MISPVKPAVRVAPNASSSTVARLKSMSLNDLGNFNRLHLSVEPELGLIAVGRGRYGDGEGDGRLTLLDFNGEVVKELKNGSPVFGAGPGPNGTWLVADQFSMSLFNANGERIGGTSFHYKNEYGEGKTQVLYVPSHQKWYVASSNMVTRLNADGSADKEYSGNAAQLHYSPRNDAVYVTDYAEPFARRVVRIGADGAESYDEGWLAGSGGATLTDTGRWGIEFSHMKHGMTVYGHDHEELFVLDVPTRVFDSGYDRASKRWFLGSEHRLDVFNQRGQWLGFHPIEQDAWRNNGAKVGWDEKTQQFWVFGEKGLEVLEGPLSADLRSKQKGYAPPPPTLEVVAPAKMVLAPDSVPAAVRPTGLGFELGTTAAGAPDAHLLALKARVVPALESFEDANLLVQNEWRTLGPEVLSASLASYGEAPPLTVKASVERALKRAPSLEQLGLSVSISEAQRRHPDISRRVEAIILAAEHEAIDGANRAELLSRSRAQALAVLHERLLPELKAAEGDERARVYAAGRAFISALESAIESLDG